MTEFWRRCRPAFEWLLFYNRIDRKHEITLFRWQAAYRARARARRTRICGACAATCRPHACTLGAEGDRYHRNDRSPSAAPPLGSGRACR